LLPFYVPSSHMISLSLIITSSFFIYGFSLLTHKITTVARPAAEEDLYPKRYDEKKKERENWLQ